MARTKKIPLNYKQKLKIIRPFVNFNYDLRKSLHPNSVNKIDRYYKYIAGELDNTGGNTIKYRPRKKQNLKKVLDATGAPPELKGLKVAFVQGRGTKVKIRFDKKGNIVFKSDYVDTAFIPLDPIQLATNTEDYVNNKIKNQPYNFYNIKYGEYDSPAIGKNKVTEQLGILLGNYDIGGKKYNGNNYFAKWLTGITGIKTKDQKTASDYTANKKMVKMAKRKEAAKKADAANKEKLKQFTKDKNKNRKAAKK